MSSYYEQVEGIEPNKIAQSKHVNHIQSASNGFRQMIQDICGEAFILDDDENAFKLTPSSNNIDQANYNYDSNIHWLDFFDIYLKQCLYIEKSGIDSIKIEMTNRTNLEVPIKAEIRDNNNKLIVSSADVKIKPISEQEGEYQEIIFNFNKQNIPIGEYYFIIYPVSVSKLCKDVYDRIYNSNINFHFEIQVKKNDFQIRYDINGSYHETLNEDIEEDSDNFIGLEVSENGSDYLPAYLGVEDAVISEGSATYNYDLSSKQQITLEDLFKSGYKGSVYAQNVLYPG